jgi:prepilin-type N-terminal cleavage/methylation domain-containing protein
VNRDAGFTLVEVMVAMLIGTIGLLGTVAVQQSMANAAKNANDAAVAMRLATQKIEELSALNTDTPGADSRIGLGSIAQNKWLPTNSSGTSVPEYVDAEGVYLRDSSNAPVAPEPGELGRYRWHRQWKVVDTGVGLPYVLSVIVTYDNDAGDAKTTRLDLERRKSW